MFRRVSGESWWNERNIITQNHKQEGKRERERKRTWARKYCLTRVRERERDREKREKMVARQLDAIDSTRWGTPFAAPCRHCGIPLLVIRRLVMIRSMSCFPEWTDSTSALSLVTLVLILSYETRSRFGQVLERPPHLLKTIKTYFIQFPFQLRWLSETSLSISSSSRLITKS